MAAKLSLYTLSSHVFKGVTRGMDFIFCWLAAWRWPYRGTPWRWQLNLVFDKSKNRKSAIKWSSLQFYGIIILVKTKPLWRGMSWLPFQKLSSCPARIWVYFALACANLTIFNRFNCHFRGENRHYNQDMYSRLSRSFTARGFTSGDPTKGIIDNFRGVIPKFGRVYATNTFARRLELRRIFQFFCSSGYYTSVLTCSVRIVLF